MTPVDPRVVATALRLTAFTPEAPLWFEAWWKIRFAGSTPTDINRSERFRNGDKVESSSETGGWVMLLDGDKRIIIKWATTFL